jgi:hypothetical protein
LIEPFPASVSIGAPANTNEFTLSGKRAAIIADIRSIPCSSIVAAIAIGQNAGQLRSDGSSDWVMLSGFQQPRSAPDPPFARPKPFVGVFLLVITRHVGDAAREVSDGRREVRV